MHVRLVRLHVQFVQICLHLHVDVPLLIHWYRSIVLSIKKANGHKSRALGTISHKIYTSLRNVRKSRKFTLKLFCT